MEDPGRLDMEVVDNKVDKAPSLTISRVMWIRASDNQPTDLHILRRQCCLIILCQGRKIDLHTKSTENDFF